MERFAAIAAGVENMLRIVVIRFWFGNMVKSKEL